MNDHDHNHASGNNLSTFVSGVIIGAALSYLFGTEDGEKLKEQLLKEGQNLLEEMGKDLEEAADKIEEAEPAEKLEEVKDKAEDIKEDLQEAVEDVPEHIAQLQKKGRRFFFKRHRAES